MLNPLPISLKYSRIFVLYYCVIWKVINNSKQNYLPNSCDRFFAATTASIKAERKADFSN